MNPKNLRALVLLLLVGLASCAKQPDQVAAKPAETPKAASIDLVPVTERSRHFLAVNRQLELGGTLYGYVDVDGDALKLAGGLQSALGQLAQTQPALAPYAKQDLGEIFKILGFDDIKAVGVSSVPDGHGYFRNRSFFYTPEGRHGLLASLGGKVSPFAHVKLAPADADFYAETEMDLPVLYQTIKQVVVKVSGEPSSDQLDATLKRAGEAASLSILDLIYGLKGHAATVLRLDPEKNLQLPGRNSPKIPAFSLLICIDGVAPVIEPVLAKSPMLKQSVVGNRRIYGLAQPPPLDGINPVIVLEGPTFYLATSLEFLNECLNQKESLDGAAQFRGALQHVGTEGNGLAYLSPRFFSRIRQLETLNPNLPGEAKSILHLIATNVPAPEQALVTVRTNLPDGILIRSYWNRSLKQDIAMISVYNPLTVGVLAAMAIPAFQKVRTASQQKAVLNNLRQFAAAGDQFCLEHGVQRASYADLVGPGKYIRALIPVAGENYRMLTYVVGEPLRVRLANGQVVDYNP